MKTLPLLAILCMVKSAVTQRSNLLDLKAKIPILPTGKINIDTPIGNIRASNNLNDESTTETSLPLPPPMPRSVQFRKDEEDWSNFKITFNKVYASKEEEDTRMINFITNSKMINRHNEEYSKGKWNFVQKINKFTDQLFYEFDKLLNGFNRLGNLIESFKNSRASTFIPSANVIYPETVDWRAVGAVTPVQFQGYHCAGCYAFAVTGALEGQIFRKTGTLEDLSEQNLIDCPTEEKYGIGGCKRGGLLHKSFDYVIDNPGIDIESAYPYYERDLDACYYQPEYSGANCTGYFAIPSGDEKALEQAVATVGPVAAAIHVVGTFQQYSDGIFYHPDCKSQQDALTHAVLVVGFGKEPNGQSYWLVKNSYGSNWGIGGYFKLAKNLHNHCGIASYAYFPQV